MISYRANIEKKTLQNKYYRKVLNTTNESQLVIMSIPVGDDIDREVHRETTQFIRIESGTCDVYVNSKRHHLKDGDVIVIPAGLEHYLKNSGNSDLKLYTIYSPPEHVHNLVQKHHN